MAKVPVMVLEALSNAWPTKQSANRRKLSRIRLTSSLGHRNTSLQSLCFLLCFQGDLWCSSIRNWEIWRAEKCTRCNTCSRCCSHLSREGQHKRNIMSLPAVLHQWQIQSRISNPAGGSSTYSKNVRRKKRSTLWLEPGWLLCTMINGMWAKYWQFIWPIPMLTYIIHARHHKATWFHRVADPSW